MSPYRKSWVSGLVFLSLLLRIGLGLALAQGGDPHQIPSTIESVVVPGVVPVLAGGGSDTIFIVQSTASSFNGAAVSSTNPVRVKIQLFGSDGKPGPEVVKALTGTGGSVAVITASSDLGATADGVAVITPSTANGADIAGLFFGSAVYIDANLGVGYDRPLVMGRGSGSEWTAFSSKHRATYIESGSVTTRVHILCPGSSSTDDSTPSALTKRLGALGVFPNTGTGITEHFDITVSNSDGNVAGTVSGISCRGANFINSRASDLARFFSSGAGGAFTVTGSTAATHSGSESPGDLILWTTIKVGNVALDARAASDPAADSTLTFQTGPAD